MELQMVTQNLEVAKVEWTLSATSDLSVALQSQKVNQAADEDLRKVLRLIMVKLGLRAHNVPKELEKTVLLSHIVSNYGNHSLNEIRLAFEMAFADKLGVDVNCYENFSCAYFSKIMNAYREWAAAEYKRIERVALPDKPDTTDEYMNEGFQFVIYGVITGSLRVADIQTVFYDWLRESGKVEDSESLHREISIEIGKQIGDSGNIAEYRGYKKMWLSGEIGQPYSDQIVLLAKQTMVKNYILKNA